MAITINLVLIAVTCLVSWLAWKDRRLLERLLLWPPAIRRGEVHRLVTYGFVHGDGQHLLFNMITLYFFGGLIEREFQPWLGPWGYALFYVVQARAGPVYRASAQLLGAERMCRPQVRIYWPASARPLPSYALRL